MTDENGIDVEARQKALREKGLMGDDLPPGAEPKAANTVFAPSGYHIAQSGKRKGQVVRDRSDKGVPKPVRQTDAPKGMLTDSEVSHIIFLTKQLQEATSRYERAERLLSDAVKEHADYLDSLKGA